MNDSFKNTTYTNWEIQMDWENDIKYSLVNTLPK